MTIQIDREAFDRATRLVADLLGASWAGTASDQFGHDEQEVVFRPGSVCLPIERCDVDDLEVAVVEELDPDHDPEAAPPFTLDQLRDQMTEEIRDARGRPQVDDITSGTFVGPPS